MRNYLKNRLDDLLESCDMRQALGMSFLFAYVLLFCLSPTFIPFPYAVSPISHIILLAILLAALILISLLNAQQRRFTTFAMTRQQLSLLMLTSGLVLSLGSFCLWLFSPAVALGISAVIIAVGAAVLVLLWARAAAAVRLRRRVVSCGFTGIISPLLYLLLIILPDLISLVLTALLPLASGLMGYLYWRYTKQNVDARPLSEPPPGKNGVKLPLDIHLCCVTFCFGCLFTLVGYALLQLSPPEVSIKVPGIICVLLFLAAQIAMAFYMVRIIHVESPKAAYRPVPVLFAIGFAVLLFGNQTAIMLSMALAFAGFGCFAIYYWIILGNITNHHRASSTLLYSFGLALLVAGALAGEVIILVSSYLASPDVPFSHLISVLGLFILVLALWQMSDGSVFANETREMGGSFANEPEAVLVENKDRAELLAATFNLSPREQEIVELLIGGRNVPAICDELFISKHTVQTHIKHIYTKTGVSKRQQLLDLAVELR